MKKENFVTLILSTIGGILFAIGMCMVMVWEGMMVQGIYALYALPLWENEKSRELFGSRVKALPYVRHSIAANEPGVSRNRCFYGTSKQKLSVSYLQWCQSCRWKRLWSLGLEIKMIFHSDKL